MSSRLSLRNAVVALLLVSTACGGSEVSESSGDLKASRTPAPSYVLQTTATYSSSPTWATGFPIDSTYNVYFAFDLPGTLTGSHTATVFVYAADGSLYQKNVVSFAAGTTAAAGQQQAQKTSTGYRVWTSLPVAGTFIQTYNMAGAWSAQAFLDSASTANASASFSLQ
jgi:hypothetical protein